MGILATLWGSKKIVDAATGIAKEIPSGIDKAFYTKEEKDDNWREQFKLWMEAQRILLNENSAFSMARRLIALISLAWYIALQLDAVVLMHLRMYIDFNVMGPAGVMIENPLRADLAGAAGYARQLAENWQGVVGLIMTFYFGPAAVEKLRGLFSRQGKSD